MAASPYSIDPTTYLDELLAQASPDLMREMLQGFINQILSTQADQICGADYATTSKSRTNVRNGYRHRDLDTRVGTIDVAVPKLRTGSFFPDWLLQRRTRAERALTTVIATCYLKGVSTRRMNDLVASLGINNLSKSQVCAEIANRGVNDVFIVCCDGLKGFPEAIQATWPESMAQT